MERNLKFEAVYPHPVERVWRAVTEPDAIAAWLMENDFQPVPGHEFEFHTKPRPGFDGTVHSRVLQVEPPLRLAYSWKGGSLDTTVVISLRPVPEGTHFCLEHRGFRGLSAIAVSYGLAAGWENRILRTSLPSVLDRLAEAEPDRTEY